MKILVIANQSPNDPFNGFDFRTWHFLGRGKADVCCFQHKQFSVSGQPLENHLNWQKLNYFNTPLNLRSFHKIDIIPSIFLLTHHRQLNIIEEYLKDYLSTNPDTLVLACGHSMGLIASKLIPGSFIFDGCDSMSLYYYRRYKALNSQQWIKKINCAYMSAVYRAVENQIARHTSLYLTPSEYDRKWVLQGCPEANVVAIGNGTPWLEQPPITVSANHQNPIIAFHGGMTWEPNRVAALYLIREIFPLVQAVLPNVVLKIAGTPVFDELASLRAQKGVEICGFVEDIREWLAKSDVYVMPMLQGSGFKNKLAEAMALGLPIVTNSLGAEAIPTDAQKALIIANEPKMIAKEIITLLKNHDQRHQLGEQARLMAEKHFCWKVLSENFMREIAKTKVFHHA
jgi:glycosyltransferase involved in cell wall biosynthesis